LERLTLSPFLDKIHYRSHTTIFRREHDVSHLCSAGRLGKSYEQLGGVLRDDQGGSYLKDADR
jgi:hypothetical protein